VIHAYIDDEMLESIVHVLRYSCSRYYNIPFISMYVIVCIDYFDTLKSINIPDAPGDIAVHCSCKRRQHWSRLQRGAVRVQKDRVRAGHRQKPVRPRHLYQHHQNQRPGTYLVLLHTTELNSSRRDAQLLLWNISLCDIISKASYCQKFMNMPCYFCLFSFLAFTRKWR